MPLANQPRKPARFSRLKSCKVTLYFSYIMPGTNSLKVEYLPTKGYNESMKIKKIPPKNVKKKQSKNGRSSREINRSFNIATSFSAAKRWDILQQISLTPEQRQRAAKELKQRVFGKHAPDVRASHPGR